MTVRKVARIRATFRPAGVIPPAARERSGRRLPLHRQPAGRRSGRPEGVRVSSPRVEPIARTEPRDRAGEVGRILVVDDEPIIREVLQEILTREGHALTMPPDAESGRKALQEGEYDLVLLDLMLPGMGGLEPRKEIRDLDPDLVVVMVTA